MRVGDKKRNGLWVVTHVHDGYRPDGYHCWAVLKNKRTLCGVDVKLIYIEVVIHKQAREVPAELGECNLELLADFGEGNNWYALGLKPGVSQQPTIQLVRSSTKREDVSPPVRQRAKDFMLQIVDQLPLAPAPQEKVRTYWTNYQP